jgi:hypothetical protein
MDSRPDTLRPPPPPQPPEPRAISLADICSVIALLGWIGLGTPTNGIGLLAALGFAANLKSRLAVGWRAVAFAVQVLATLAAAVLVFLITNIAESGRRSSWETALKLVLWGFVVVCGWGATAGWRRWAAAREGAD